MTNTFCQLPGPSLNRGSIVQMFLEPSGKTLLEKQVFQEWSFCCYILPVFTLLSLTDLSRSSLVFWLINKFQVVFENFQSSGKFIKLNGNKGVPVMSKYPIQRG